MAGAGLSKYFGRGYYSLYRNYLIPAEQSAAEAAFLVRTLRPKTGERWLDLPCGYGRHLLELGRLRPDLRLFGGDLNRQYLNEKGLCEMARPACCDMRRLPFRDGSFHAVLNMLNSFGYHPAGKGENGDRRMLAECARVLRRGGRLVLDVPDRRALLGLVRTQPRIRYCADDYEVIENFEWNAARECLVNWTKWTWPGGTEFATYRLRLYTPAQLARILESTGFEIRAQFGDFRGGAFVAGRSERLLLVCRRT